MSVKSKGKTLAERLGKLQEETESSSENLEEYGYKYLTIPEENFPLKSYKKYLAENELHVRKSVFVGIKVIKTATGVTFDTSRIEMRRDGKTVSSFKAIDAYKASQLIVKLLDTMIE